ncbi:hypothetical protein DH2020_014441 [Rehmannia glutinosa]|uniref:Reverse transcriptase domain-containing protein n=1 Tax=Rehmannia glutinosa TaxID=99300 RepID=A0ABR0WWY1_REHGL
MILKIDIRKAFDTLRWDFLLYVLRRFGFSETFVRWVEVVLRSSRISVLLNGMPVGYFACSRGVRQGDPLSPLLFCIAKEVLGRLITSAMDQSSLLYAGDILILEAANSSNSKFILNILEGYGNASGQFFSLEKSKIYVNDNISRQLPNCIQTDFGISRGSVPFTYLGAPLFKGAPMIRLFQPLFDKIVSKFQTWKGNSLFMAATLLKQMEKAMRNFIWTGDVNSKGKVVVNWDTCCTPRAEGGLGVRSLKAANKAFLMKLG